VNSGPDGGLGEGGCRAGFRPAGRWCPPPVGAQRLQLMMVPLTARPSVCFRRAPARIVWRCIRGMTPHKTVRGNEAMGRLKTFEGVPPAYEAKKRMVIPEALRVLRLKHGSRYCRLGDLSTQVGWRHGATVAKLEEARLAKAAEWHAARKTQVAKVRAAYKKAEASV